MAASPGLALRRLFSQSPEAAIAMPGAFNGLVARAVAQEGFQAAYVSGAGVAASMGLPDVGLATMDDFCRIVRDVATSSGLPVLADADTGFGGVESAGRVVYEYRRAGAAGLHLEDQVFPKRCGHLDGKALVPATEFALKIQEAARVRDEGGGPRGEGDNHFIVCARTDARGVEGLAQAIDRAKRYVDAGADMIFPEGLQSEDEFRQVASALRGYNGGRGPFLLANLTEFGKTPNLPLDKFTEMGYDCVIYPMSFFRLAMKACVTGLRELKEHGQLKDSTIQKSMLTRKETYHLLGYTPSQTWAYPHPSHASTTSSTQRTGFQQDW